MSASAAISNPIVSALPSRPANALLVHCAFELRAGVRDRSLLLMNYLFPLLFYVMVATLMTSLNPTFYETMIPAMVCFAILTSLILGMPNPLVTARETGILRSYRVNGVPATNILAVPALTTSLHALIVGIIIAITGTAFFGATGARSWPSFAGVAVLLALACAGLGALIGVIAADNRQTVLWSQLIFLPGMLLGGLMVPSSMLPPTLRFLGRLLPTTYAMRAFGWAQGTGGVSAGDALLAGGILLAGGVLAFGLAAYLFQWDSRNTTRRGHTALAALALLPYLIGAVALG